MSTFFSQGDRLVTQRSIIGYPSEVAKEIGDSLLNLVFDKGVEEGQFKIVFDQPDIGRSQAVLFRLGEETTLQLPGGKSVKVRLGTYSSSEIASARLRPVPLEKNHVLLRTTVPATIWEPFRTLLSVWFGINARR